MAQLVELGIDVRSGRRVGREHGLRRFLEQVQRGNHLLHRDPTLD